MPLLNTEWRPVSPTQAEGHPAYGFEGWLLFFYAYALFGLALPIMSVFGGGGGTAAMFGAENVTMMRTVNAVRLILLLPFLVLAPMKHRWMPAATIAAYWLSFAIMAVALLVGDVPARRTGIVMSLDAVTALLYTAYLVFSVRVNVTYRHRVPS